MQRETVLAAVRATLEFTPEAQKLLTEEYEGFWGENPDGLLFEFGATWRGRLNDILAPAVEGYFAEIGVSEGDRPFVTIGESYRGSFITDAFVLIAATVPTAFAVLKGTSELPKIAEGLGQLRSRIEREYERASNDAARQMLINTLRGARRRRATLPATASPAPVLPSRIVSASLTIDARPLVALKPEQPTVLKSHIAVAVTRGAVSVENLADDGMQNVQIGLFVNDSEQHSWSLRDGFVAAVPVLSAKQSISKSMADFMNGSRPLTPISDSKAQYVDCWVQYEHGIHLFQFLLPAL